MSDLIERLKRVEQAHNGGMSIVAVLCGEAAAELERHADTVRLHDLALEDLRDIAQAYHPDVPRSKSHILDSVTVIGAGIKRERAELARLREENEKLNSIVGPVVDVADEVNGKEWPVYEIQTEVSRLRSIVDRLPKCWRLDENGKLVQDVPVVPGMNIWMGHALGVERVKDTAWIYRSISDVADAIWCNSEEAAAALAATAEKEQADED